MTYWSWISYLFSSSVAAVHDGDGLVLVQLSVLDLMPTLQLSWLQSPGTFSNIILSNNILINIILMSWHHLDRGSERPSSELNILVLCWLGALDTHLTSCDHNSTNTSAQVQSSNPPAITNFYIQNFKMDNSLTDNSTIETEKTIQIFKVYYVNGAEGRRLSMQIF